MSLIEKALEQLDERAHARRTQRSKTGQAAVWEDEDLRLPPDLEAAAEADLDAQVSGGRDADGDPVRSREVEIDFRPLLACGMLAPNSVDTAKAEEYRRIKRPILARAFGGEETHGPPPNVVMVTSAISGEGKTFTAVNLAISVAMEMDKTALLIDADVFRSDASRLLGLDGTLGLVDLLAGDAQSVSDVLLRTNIPRLSVISAGKQRVRSAELFSSQRTVALARELATRYHDRLVILDTPPLLAASEGVALTDVCGQVVLVVEAERTRQSVLLDALEVIDPSKLTGLILNKSSRRIDQPYGYGQGYG